MLNNQFDVNYLLSISRLPDHFYAMIYNLQGKDIDYKNPAVSLRSYVIANCLKQDLVYTAKFPTTVVESVIECEKFSRSSEILSKITTILIEEADKILSVSRSYPELHLELASLNDAVLAMKLVFDAFIMNQDHKLDQVDILSPQGIKLRHFMFEIDNIINELNYLISQRR